MSSQSEVFGVSLAAFLLTLGFVAFVIGIAQFFDLAIDDTSGKDRPSIDAELEVTDAGVVLVASVKAAGLRSDEHVEVLIQGLNSRITLSDLAAGPGPRERDAVATNQDPSSEFDSPQQLLLSRIGGNREGRVEATLKIPISQGIYERVRVIAALNSLGEDLDAIERLKGLRATSRQNQELVDRARTEFAEDELALSLIAWAETIEGDHLISAANQFPAPSDTSANERTVNTSDQTTTSTTLSEGDSQELEAAIKNWPSAVEMAVESMVTKRKAELVELLTTSRDSLEATSDLAVEIKRIETQIKVITEALQDDPLPETVKISLPDEEHGPRCPQPETAADSTATTQAATTTTTESPEEVTKVSLGQGASHVIDAIRVLPAECTTGVLEMETVAERWSQAIGLDLELDPKPSEPDRELIDAVIAAGTIRELANKIAALTPSIEQEARDVQECRETDDEFGCVTLLMPETQMRAVVGISVAADRSQGIDVSVKASEVGDSDAVRLLVAAGPGSRDSKIIMTTSLGSGTNGTIDETFRVPISKGTEYVCAVANIERRTLTPLRGLVPAQLWRIETGDLLESDISSEPMNGDASAGDSASAPATGGQTSESNGDPSVCLTPPTEAGFYEMRIPPAWTRTTMAPDD